MRPRRRTIVFIVLFVALIESAGAQYQEDKFHVFPTAPVPVPYGWNFGYMISARIGKPFLGVEGNLYDAKLRVFTGQYSLGQFGLDISHIGNKYSSFQKVKLYYSSPDLYVGDLMCGLWFAPGVWRVAYNTQNFHETEPGDPVFAEITSKISPLADAGIRLGYRNLSLNLWGENIYKPNLSLIRDESGQIPASFFGLVHYSLGNFYPWVGVEYSGATKKILPGGGINLFYKHWRFSVGYLRSALSVSFSAPVQMGKLWTKYEANYHTASTEVASAGATSHCLGIDLLIPRHKKPPPPKTNLKIEPGEMPDIWNLDTMFVSVAITNPSEVPSESTSVSAFAISANETIQIGVQAVPPVQPGKEYLAQFEWLPPEPGSYKFVFTADDDGSHFPGIFGTIEESNEEDNRFVHEIIVLGELNVTVSPLLQVLTIPTVTFVREDEPIVPLVFFDSASAAVPQRFDSTLQIIAERMQLNPDVVLELRGYIDPESDGDDTSLASARMDSVARKLIKFGVPPSSIIKVPLSEYDPTKPRIPIRTPNIPPKEKRMIQEENRRVEMIARFQDIPHMVYEFNLGGDAADIPGKIKTTLDTIAQKLAGVLCSDHSAVILVEGVLGRDENPVSMLRTLDVVRNYLLPRLQVFCPLERIPIALADEKSKKSKVRIWLSAEKIIFQPVEQAEAAKEFKIPDDVRRNLIIISVNNPDYVRSYKIYAVNEDIGRVVRHFAAGDGPPPSQVVWDWRDDNGNLIDPRGTYRVVLEITDQMGRKYNFLSDPIWVIVEEWEKRFESSIVVQFTFDEAVSTSKYLESRLEEFAREIIDKTQIPDNVVKVQLTGHTDIIGTQVYNLKLSQLRAEKELKYLRNLMKFLLNLETDFELDQWMKENNLTLTAVGKGESEPYYIERYRNGKFEKVLVGDNNLPEGRSVNRRVVIDVSEMIKK